MPNLVPSVRTKTQSVFPPRAIVYKKSQASGVVLLPREFKGVGPLLAFSVPSGVTASAYLLAPTGPRSAGNPPRAQVTVGSTTDVVITEA